LEGDGRGGYGAGGERIAMAAWRMLTRRRQNMDNSAHADRVSSGDVDFITSECRTGDGEALLQWCLEGVTVKVPCGGVRCWKWEEVREGEQRDERDEGVFETVNGFMIPWFENVE
jgi:hypothetical protein